MSAQRPPPELVAQLSKLREQYGDDALRAASECIPKKVTSLLDIVPPRRRAGKGPRGRYLIVEDVPRLNLMAFIIAADSNITARAAALLVLKDEGIPKHQLGSRSIVLCRKFKEGRDERIEATKRMLDLLAQFSQAFDAIRAMAADAEKGIERMRHAFNHIKWIASN